MKPGFHKLTFHYTLVKTAHTSISEDLSSPYIREKSYYYASNELRVITYNAPLMALASLGPASYQVIPG